MIRVFKASFLPLVVIALISAVGCTESTEATKLKAPEGVDWAAIEAEGNEMNDLQSEGE